LDNGLLITIGMFGSMLIVLFSGVPVVFGLGALAIIWGLVTVGPQLMYFVALNYFSTTTSEILICLPMFIFMAHVLAKSGIADEAYDMAYKWLGNVNGGLAMGTIAVCTIFAACVGETGPAVLTLGVVALPSMLKRKYHSKIALGSIAGGAGLGTLIPPSVPMIIYASLAKESVGRLFMGGVGPGLLLSLFYIVYIGVRARLQPELAPSLPESERVSWSEKLRATRALILPILLVVLVLGSIYSGVATPTEAGTIGAFGSIIVALVKRRLNWQNLKEALFATLLLTAFGFWILVGSNVFACAYQASGAAMAMLNILISLPVSPWVILIIFEIVIIILGMIMDDFAVIMICTPLFVPVITALGFDKVWFGVLFIINIQMAYLTPPYGFVLFWIKSILPKGLTTEDIYRAVWPYIIMQAAGLAICIAFPQIIMWLPNQMIK